MRLLKIGRDASCDIVLQSSKVSSIHAELTLLNSGDILLEDKGSSNGTFIMNQPIKPGKPVNVRRGDAIRFADVELQWSQVPMPEDNSAYQGIYGIGSHFNNEIQVTGSTVSRYHATIKHGRDGKMYIVDHSKNGTVVNGLKITSNTPVRIKKNSSVSCGGVPVDLSRLPWPSGIWKNIGLLVASLLIVAGATFGLYKWLDRPDVPTLQALQNATTCVMGEYYIEVTIKDDPFVGRVNGWPEKWYFGVNQNKELSLGTLTNVQIQPIFYRGTAFYISKYGELGTNRHIACPWDYLGNDVKDDIRQEMEVFLNSNFIRKQLYKLLEEQILMGLTSIEEANARLLRLQKSELEISGRHHSLGIINTGETFTNLSELKPCKVIATSDDIKQDVALIRLNSKKTPSDIIEAGFFDINHARIDEKSLLPQEDELTIMGYPAEFDTGMNLVTDNKEYRPTVHRSYVSVQPGDNMFQLQSNVVGGQSGSPVIDKERHLVGVVWGSIRGTQVAWGCNIKHLKALYDKNKVTPNR